MPSVIFEPIQLPTLEVPAHVPEVPAHVFEQRYEHLEKVREDTGFDCLLIYADREHSANLAWVTNFDPRFEEALWIQGRGTPTLLVGNECFSFAPSQLKLEASIELYQPFSLLNQDRSQSTDLHALLRKAGLDRGMQCGVAGWKSMERPEIPFWIVSAIMDVTGSEPTNANPLLMDPDTGLRTRLEPETVRFFEYAHSVTSEAMKRWVFGLREGMTERDAAASLQSYGLELSCHPMVNFGSPIPSGLKSPRNNQAQRGHYAQAALGVTGALTSRAGRLVTREDTDVDGYLELVANYLSVVRAWYGRIEVGALAGEVVAAATAAKADSWLFSLNPGHLISLDEWLSSPFYEASTIKLKSGYAIQQDIIPVPKQGNAVINMEDGFVLADAELRTALQELDPALVKRLQVRRTFMEELGYELSEDILPLSNIPGAFFPFLFEPSYIARFS